MILSIVIPIYNGLPYLKETLDSIQSQNNMKMEVLLIDDGSTDATKLLCDEYAAKNSNYHYYYKSNGGLSSARNYGLERSQGEYIWFVDADDLLEPDSISTIIMMIDNYIQKPDIIFSNTRLFPMRRVLTKPYKYDVDLIRKSKADELLCYFIQEFGNIWSVWSHLYRRDFIMDNRIRFNERATRGEDADWMLKVIMAAMRYDSYPPVIYQYRVNNSGSVNKKRTLALFSGGYHVSVYWYRFFEETELFPLSKHYMMYYFSQYYHHYGEYIPFLTGTDQEKAFEMYHQNTDIENYYNTNKEKLGKNTSF
mgnify:CR=1 FL=1